MLQGKKKRRWGGGRNEEEKLRIKSNVNQELKLEEKRERGAHEQACSEAQNTHVSASPTGCLLRQMENHWFQPEPSDPSMHTRQ